jgi:hypothetical protein
VNWIEVRQKSNRISWIPECQKRKRHHPINWEYEYTKEPLSTSPVIHPISDHSNPFDAYGGRKIFIRMKSKKNYHFLVMDSKRLYTFSVFIAFSFLLLCRLHYKICIPLCVHARPTSNALRVDVETINDCDNPK